METKSASAAGGEVQLTVKFVTKLPDELKVPETPLTVPGSSKRGGLSKVINHLLQRDSPRPFDFVVQGKLLRSSLHEHFLQQNLSVEEVIVVEYIPVILPPKTKKSAVHDDWISSIDSRSSVILTASYDGIVKGWTSHEHPVSCVRSIQAEELFLTASQDYQVKAWSCFKEEAIPKLVALLKGHSESVCSVDVSPDGQRCCSVGWGGQIYLWQCGRSLLKAENTSDATPKRQKMDPSSASIPQISPLGQLEGHTGCVSDVIWPREKRLFTSGWDHTLRRWDVTTGAVSETLTSHRVIQSITCPPDGSSLIAFGSTDAILRLWDARTKAENISLHLYRSHHGGISCVTWSPISDYHLASASFDHSIRVWDIRGSVPVVSTASHTDKCLSVDWFQEWTLASGGADCAVQLSDVNPSLM